MGLSVWIDGFSKKDRSDLLRLEMNTQGFTQKIITYCDAALRISSDKCTASEGHHCHFDYQLEMRYRLIVCQRTSRDHCSYFKYWQHITWCNEGLRGQGVFRGMGLRYKVFAMTQETALSSEQGTRSEKTLKKEIDIQFPLMFATLRLSVIIAPSEAVPQVQVCRFLCSVKKMSS